MLTEFFQKYKSIILYIIIGGLTTVVNLLVYSIFVKYFNLNMNISNIIAWISAVIFAFITNKLYVFNSKNCKFNTMAKEFILFVSGRLLTGILEIIGLPILMSLGINQIIFGVEGLLAKLVIGVVVVILNYFFSKFLVFKNNQTIK
ncbi:GtrA family protein [Peptostreptococcaceae bacterium OttesenSCG-928-C18]|nr:GtrA family protein [Peptostreptococcaceae bacterium OttesenSCG-928-C18]